MRSHLSQVTYCVGKDGELAEISNYVDRIKANHNDVSSSVPDFTVFDDFILRTGLTVTDLDGNVLTVHIGPHTIEAI